MMPETFLARAILTFTVIFALVMCKMAGEDLSGRIGRRRYITRHLVIAGVACGLFMLRTYAGTNIDQADLIQWCAIIGWVVISIFMLWFVFTTDVKRLQDMNLSAWWLIIVYSLCAPVLGLDIALGILVLTRLLMAVIPGSRDNNTYGYNHDKNYMF